MRFFGTRGGSGPSKRRVTAIRCNVESISTGKEHFEAFEGSRGKLRNISIEFSCNARTYKCPVRYGMLDEVSKERLETVETTPRPRFCPFHQKKRTFSIFYILIWSFVIYSPSRYRHVYVFLVSFYRVARSVRCSLPFS